MTARPSPAEVAAVASLTADFPPWHAWLSTRRPGDGPPRVWAVRVWPVSPHRHENSLTGPLTGCGITLDADTPGQMRDLLTARCAS
jgi:hypothetical protein